MSEPWIAPVHPAVVWFSGTDALRFLNDLISQEMGDMADGEARRSFLLEPQGKLRFLLWVIRDGERYGLVSEDGRGDELAAALGRYRIRVDVDITLEDSETTIVVQSANPGPQRLGEAAPPSEVQRPQFARMFDIGWAGAERWLVMGERPDLPEGEAGEYERVRIEAGEPRWGVDVDEGTIPHESGLVPASVDFDKGCFLGQELVARIDSRGGNTPRHLRSLHSESEIGTGEQITLDGDEVGAVTSAAGNMGLAMLKRAVSVGDTVEVGGVSARVEALPHQKLDDA